jgi:hypothetical protein
MSGFVGTLRGMQQKWAAEDAQRALGRMQDLQHELAEVQAAWFRHCQPRHTLAAIRTELALEHERQGYVLERALEVLRDLGPVAGTTLRTNAIQEEARHIGGHYQDLEREWRRYIERETAGAEA